MKIAVNPGYIAKTPGAEPMPILEATLLCKKCGFDAVDLGSYTEGGDEGMKNLRLLGETIAEAGITVEQTHAPFNRYKAEPIDVFRGKMQRAFESAVALGARRIVLHGDEYRAPDGTPYRESDAIDYAVEFFSPYVEYALKNGLDVAFENVFEDGYLGLPRCGSSVDALIETIDRFADSRVGCCWDFGHAAVEYKTEMLSALTKVGRRLSCTHVHDNAMNRDAHLPPFLGTVDWAAHAKYLRESGYDGAFTYEFVYGAYPTELKEDFLKMTFETAKHILRAGGYRI